MTSPSKPPNGFPHWMLAEIYEQPEALRRTLDHYVQDNSFCRETTAPITAWLSVQRQLLIAASGSSRHAGLAGEILLEDVTTLPVDVEYASEYSFRTPQTESGAGVVVISQSGETADTLLALRRALSARRPTLAITNVPGSTMMREAQVAMPLLAGPEHAIPATKSFTAQLLAMTLLSLLAAEVQGSLSHAEIAARLVSLHDLPARIAAQLTLWNAAAQDFAQSSHRRQQLPVLRPGYPLSDRSRRRPEAQRERLRPGRGLPGRRAAPRAHCPHQPPNPARHSRHLRPP